MSRLQVGGLALVIKAVNPKNLGVVVSLIGFEHDFWIVEGNLNGDHGLIGVHSKFIAKSDQLMPLGDKQTQDELAKGNQHEFN